VVVGADETRCGRAHGCSIAAGQVQATICRGWRARPRCCLTEPSRPERRAPDEVC
jgi:hypothetical protein